MTKPYFCRVEYLESTGTQYIDTGFTCGQTDDFTITENVAWTSWANGYASDYNAVNGQTGETEQLFFGPKGKNTTNQFYYGIESGGVTYTESTYTGLNERHIYELTRSEGKSIIKKDGVELYNGTKTGPVVSKYIIFGCVNYGGSHLYSLNSMKNYGTKIIKNGTLVRDFIPVLDNSGRPAMYDQVSGQLFYNQGTGEFNYGRQIIPVEYLESTGTQYINTGVAGNNNNLSFDFMYTNLTSNNYGGIFGNYGSGENDNCWRLLASNAAEGTSYLCTNTKASSSKTLYLPLNNAFEIHIDKDNYSVNGTTYNSPTPKGTNNNTNIAIFAQQVSTEYPFNSAMKLNYFKIKDGDTLIRDFIPAIDENGVGFMFDNLSNTIYDNEGTGAFKFGPNAEKKGNKKLLRKKLALMLANLKKERKYYCELEYLEGTGTQYINTGYTLNNNSEVEIICNSGDVHGTNLFGYREASANSKNISITTSISVVYTSDFNNSNYATYRVSMDGSGDKIVKITLSKNERGFYNLDGSLINRGTTVCPDVFTCGSPAYLMNVSGSPYFTTSFKGKLYRCTIKESGVLVRDFIPVLDWNYVPCMYDKVSGQLFYNAGTGNFVAGREIHTVEYMESTGTQYIDTGIIGDLTTELTCEAAIVQAGNASVTNIMGNNVTSTRAISINMSANITNPSVSRIRFGNTFNTTVAGSIDLNTFYKYTTNKDNLTVQDIGGTILNTYAFNATTAFTTDGNILIYKLGDTSTQYIGNIKVKGATIKNNGVLVRDYIPAIDENGVGFMFDRVTHTIYDNEGTGAFKYPARELEYIEATGTQYLNTGWNPGANAGQFTFEVEVNCTENTSGHGAIGSRSVDAGRNWVITNVNNAQLGTLSQYGYGNTYQNVIANTSDKWSKMKTYISGNDYVFETTVDGVTYSEYTPVQSFTNTANVYLMGINNKGTRFSSFPFIGKIRRAKLYDRGTLVKDYRPAFKNGYFGLWDAVNDYMPAITGTVTYGKIVEPEYE